MIILKSEISQKLRKLKKERTETIIDMKRTNKSGLLNKERQRLEKKYGNNHPKVKDSEEPPPPKPSPQE